MMNVRGEEDMRRAEGTSVQRTTQKGLTLELAFSVAFAHAPTTAATTLDGSNDAVHVACATPLLMGQNIDAKLLFAPLNEINVRKHSICLEVLGELVRNRCVRMHTSEGDELQHESE